MEAEVIPVILGALGVVTKETRTYPNKLPGCQSLENLQQNALLGTCNILRKVLK